MNPRRPLSAIGLLALVAAFSFLSALPLQGLAHMTPLVITNPEGAYRLIYLSILGSPVVLLVLLLALRPRAEFTLPVGLGAIGLGLAASGRTETLPIVLLVSSLVSIGIALSTAGALVLAVDRLPRRALLAVVAAGFVGVLAGASLRTPFDDLPFPVRRDLLISGFAAMALAAAWIFWPRSPALDEESDEGSRPPVADRPVAERAPLPAVEIVRSLLLVAAAFLLVSLLAFDPDPASYPRRDPAIAGIVLPGLVIGGLLLRAWQTRRAELRTALVVLGASLVLAGVVGTFFPVWQGNAYEFARALLPGIVSVAGLRLVVGGRRFRLARAYAPIFAQTAAGFIVSQAAAAASPSGGLGRLGTFVAPLAVALFVLLVVPTTSRERASA